MKIKMIWGILVFLSGVQCCAGDVDFADGYSSDDTKDQKKLNSDLLKAATDGNAQKIEQLLADGADIHTKNCEDDRVNFYGALDTGNTPLHYAAIKGHLGVITFLLNRGAEINEKNSCGWTPLYYAAYMAHMHGFSCRCAEVARILLDRDADVDITDTNGNTVLHYLVVFGELSLVRLVLDAGARVTIPNHQGKTVIDIVKDAICLDSTFKDAVMTLLQQAHVAAMSAHDSVGIEEHKGDDTDDDAATDDDVATESESDGEHRESFCSSLFKRCARSRASRIDDVD